MSKEKAWIFHQRVRLGLPIQGDVTFKDPRKKMVLKEAKNSKVFAKKRGFGPGVRLG